MGKLYHIKLPSGRILGPLDLTQIRSLILKQQVVGQELAQEHPHGTWQDINQIRDISELLLAFLSGTLKEVEATIAGNLEGLPGADANPSTLPLSLEETKQPPPPPQEDSNEEKTVLGEWSASSLPASNDLEEATHIFEAADKEQVEFKPPAFSQDKTIALARPSQETTTLQYQAGSKAKKKKKKALSPLVLALLVGFLMYDFLFPDEEHTQNIIQANIKPRLPTTTNDQKPDPEASAKIYTEGMRHYLLDNVTGYRNAAEKFQAAATLDNNNVKALAMLASTYLNLIDSSNKDENYFYVISKLIERSRARSLDLTETIIADVEFYLILNKAVAAQNEIIDYTKTHQKFGLELFYYLALTFYARGDPASGSQYLNQIPDEKAFSSKVFYLRGMLAEKVNNNEEALKIYQHAIQQNSTHAKSRLRIARLLQKKGSLKEAANQLAYLIKNKNLLSSRDLALAYFLNAQLEELNQHPTEALKNAEFSIQLDPENHVFLMEFYNLQSQMEKKKKDSQQLAKMYYFLWQGETLLQQGRIHDALVQFLEARRVNKLSPIPLLKIGDMFTYLNDIENAKTNYKTASVRAPNNIQIWSKYIKSLIQSYEWEEAEKAMDRFRKFSVHQSTMDKVAADLYQKQGRFAEAQTYYKKAMARDTIDPTVYIAYGESLMSTQNYKEAPFFFALALRFDPLNTDAIINTAKCIAETDSIDHAINHLEDELKKSDGSQAELLSAIAEFQIQKGNWTGAQQNIEQAIQAKPDYAYPWKLQARLYLSHESQDKKAIDKALNAYKFFLDLNPSDATGYLERSKLFVKKTDYESAKLELTKIYAIFPKYPNLHFQIGKLYALQGNHVAAHEEFQTELNNNPNSVPTLITDGQELLELTKYDAALTNFTKAMQISPQSAPAIQFAGWTNYKLGHHQAAIALLNNAIRLDKANPIIYKRLGIVYRDLSDLTSACREFRKYLEMEPDAPDKSEFQSCF